MKKIFGWMVFGILALVPLCHVMAQGNKNTGSNTVANDTSYVDADVNAAGETTSMNGNTSTNAGVSISSTSASSESRSTSGSSSP